MLLFGYTLRRYAPAFPLVFVVSAVLCMLWLPSPAIVPYPSTGAVGGLEMALPVLLCLPLSFLLHDKAVIELSLVHGVSTLRLFMAYLCAALTWSVGGLVAVVLCLRFTPLDEQQIKSLAYPPHIPDGVRWYVLLSALITLLFFVSVLMLLRVALRNCYVPIVVVLLMFTVFYDRSKDLRMGGPDGMGTALFDPYMSTYVIGDAVPLQYGYGHLWTANRVLFLGLALVFFLISILLLRRERMHE